MPDLAYISLVAAFDLDMQNFLACSCLDSEKVDDSKGSERKAQMREKGRVIRATSRSMILRVPRGKLVFAQHHVQWLVEKAALPLAFTSSTTIKIKN